MICFYNMRFLYIFLCNCCYDCKRSYELFNEFRAHPRNESVQTEQRNIMLHFTKAEVKPVGRGGEKVTSSNV